MNDKNHGYEFGDTFRLYILQRCNHRELTGRCLERHGKISKKGIGNTMKINKITGGLR